MVSRSTSVFARSVSQNDMRCVARGLIVYKCLLQLCSRCEIRCVEKSLLEFRFLILLLVTQHLIV